MQKLKNKVKTRYQAEFQLYTEFFRHDLPIFCLLCQISRLRINKMKILNLDIS